MKVRGQIRGEGRDSSEATRSAQFAATQVAQGAYRLITRNNYNQGGTWVELWVIEYDSR